MKIKAMLLSLLWITLLTSCASLPPPPQGQLCVFNAKTLMSDCVPISPSIVTQVGDKYHLNIEEIVVHTQSQVPASDMDNWVTIDPDSWKNIEAYINQLKNRLKACLNP